MQTPRPLEVLIVAALSAVPANCRPSGPKAVTPAASTSASTGPSTIPPPTSGSAKGVQGEPPATPRRPVAETMHGVKVTDDYRWLEDSGAPEVKTWIAAQNVYARTHLDAYPGRAALRARVRGIVEAASADRYSLRYLGKRFFALKDQPPKQQPFLVTFTSEEDVSKEKVVLDPNVLDPKGGTAIDFYVPSPDGKLVAVSLSKGGSEVGDLHVYEVDGGKERTLDTIPRVNGGTAGGSVAFTGDGKALAYTRYPREGERSKADLDFFQEVWVHRLGSAASADFLSLGNLPRIAETQLETSRNGKWMIASVANGDGGEMEHWIASAEEAELHPKLTKDKGRPAWRRVSKFLDKVVHAQVGLDGMLYLLSRNGAPKGKILRLPPGKPVLAQAEEIVSESADAVIEQFVVTKTKLYVVDLLSGPSRIRVIAHGKKSLAALTVPILPVSSVQHVEPIDEAGDDVLFRNQSYLSPPAFFRYDAKEAKTTRTALFKTSPVSFDDAEVTRETCTSKDGTAVPISILHKKGVVRNGENLAVLYGYGGYGVSLSPRFRGISRLFLDQGGIYAVANLRGGGELGEEWHAAGNLTRKQNVFDDFAACARHLADRKYTRPARLAIHGASNGGLLASALLTQHPELFAAAVSQVGIHDMLRVELTPNGAFNVTEFGTVKDKAQFEALYAYSPYHRVKDGTRYPAVLFTTGANDPRVDPWHSRKMTARLQAADAGGGPFLLRTSGDTGHGMGTPLSEEIDETVDLFSFLFGALGHTYVGG